jgi:hypothetical protein
MAEFDPKKSASANYLAGLQAARKASGAFSKVQPLIDAHINRDRQNDKSIVSKKRTPKKATPKKPNEMGPTDFKPSKKIKKKPLNKNIEDAPIRGK